MGPIRPTAPPPAGQAVVLFSGGSDSTLTAALEAERAGTVQLLTFGRRGIHHVENSRRNLPRLRQRYGEDRFEHHILDVDPLFSWLSFQDYPGAMWRDGFMLLSTCGLCKLAMHLRALLFCLEHGIVRVADGANRQMNVYPAQMAPVLAALRRMYAHFGIEYANPVFEMDGPSEMGFHPSVQGGLFGDGASVASGAETTDHRLWELGILDAPSTKGTRTDHAMQPRCFQFVLFRVWTHWLYLPRHGYDRYVEQTTAFFEARISRVVAEVERWRDQPEGSRLQALLQASGEAR